MIDFHDAEHLMALERWGLLVLVVGCLLAGAIAALSFHGCLRRSRESVNEVCCDHCAKVVKRKETVIIYVNIGPRTRATSLCKTCFDGQPCASFVEH